MVIRIDATDYESLESGSAASALCNLLPLSLPGNFSAYSSLKFPR